MQTNETNSVKHVQTQMKPMQQTHGHATGHDHEKLPPGHEPWRQCNQTVASKPNNNRKPWMEYILIYGFRYTLFEDGMKLLER